MAAGEPFGLQPGHTSTIRRIEGAMLSYHADMDINTNPFELGLDRLVDLDMKSEFIGKQALRSIRAEGVTRLQVGLEIEGQPLARPNEKHWPLRAGSEDVGYVTSAVYSPRLEKNIALGIARIDQSRLGSGLITLVEGEERTTTVVEKPFYDPKKKIASA